MINYILTLILPSLPAPCPSRGITSWSLIRRSDNDDDDDDDDADIYKGETFQRKNVDLIH